jgi:hypothetical protein
MITNMKQIDPNIAVDFIIKNAKEYAQAKAEVTYLEQFRQSKKAMLFNNSIGKTIADKENYAYSHPDYLELLEGLKVAVEKAEMLRWQLIAAQERVNIWRSQEASNRNIDRSTQ